MIVIIPIILAAAELSIFDTSCDGLQESPHGRLSNRSRSICMRGCLFGSDWRHVVQCEIDKLILIYDLFGENG